MMLTFIAFFSSRCLALLASHLVPFIDSSDEWISAASAWLKRFCSLGAARIAAAVDLGLEVAKQLSLDKRPSNSTSAADLLVLLFSVLHCCF